MHWLYLALGVMAVAHTLWFLFIGIMAMQRVSKAGQLTKTALYLGLPWLVLGFVLDVIGNMLISVPLLELPQEWTVSARLKRHILFSKGWRFKFALWFVPLLDPFDPSGHHITVPTKGGM
jgi:hypothetical protein